jgi:cytoskeletal protein CcmA (bactofilin family)
MWTKDQPSSSQPSPSGAAPYRPATPPATSSGAAATILGETIRIQGQVSSREEIVLNGELSGQLELDQRLTVGPKGKVEANIKAKEVIIGGSIKGNVDAAERIPLRAGANLVGDVKTAGIVIEDGAYFKGGIDITRPAQSAVAQAAAAQSTQS